MKIKLPFIFAMFIIAFTVSNILVKAVGPWGLWISSFLLIPFDFVSRCVIHERLKGLELFAALFCLTAFASIITVLFNFDAINIAAGSLAAFTAAQIVAGVFYQIAKAANAPMFTRVNGTDLLAIIVDSTIFQLIAFSDFDYRITIGQTIIKFSGGLVWYYFLFHKYKLHERIN